MTDHFTIALAQINQFVGDLAGNSKRMLEARAAASASDLIVYPELQLIGYPPEDLVLKPGFIDDAALALEALAAHTGDGGPAMLVGTALRHDGQIYNAMALLDEGKVAAYRLKHELPNYGTFDEKRLFSAGPLPQPLVIRGLSFGVAICEDIWVAEVANQLRNQGAEIIVAANASPFEIGKNQQRKKLASQRVSETGLPLIYVNRIGGQDELVFDGASFVMNADTSQPIALAKWQEQIVLTQWHRSGGAGLWQCDAQQPPELCYQRLSLSSALGVSADVGSENQDASHTGLTSLEEKPFAQAAGRTASAGAGAGAGLSITPPLLAVPGDDDVELLADIYCAMVTGLRDYVARNGFPGVLLGLSGGIDSALSIAVAVDALGADRISAVMLPSRYTGQESLDDAAECARLLGVKLDNIAIHPAVQALEAMLAPAFKGRAPDLAEENIQSRIRGVTLMGLSNKFGHMLLTTGNKSEMAVGYSTIYGDMAGGYSVLKDVYKTTVFALSRWRNHYKPSMALGPDGPVMPDNVISKPPTAELRDNQKDADSLPPYDSLDQILTALVEYDLTVDEIIALGHDRDTVVRIERLVYLAEYKRRQAPPGVKITRRNFGRDRRYPITHAYRTA